MKRILDTSEKFQKKIFVRLINDKDITKLPKKKNLASKKTLIPSSNYHTEWWYTSGRIRSGKRVFGYELTFFRKNPHMVRLGIFPASFLSKKDMVIVHFALTDVNKRSFTFTERRSLNKPLYISHSILDIKLDTFSIKSNNHIQIAAKTDNIELNLRLTPLKKMIGHGDAGYVIKEQNPLSAAYYLSYTRLETKGTLIINNNKMQVTGRSWMDHEKNYVHPLCSVKGWIWFSLIFDDGTEIMLYNLLDKNNNILPNSAGTYIDKETHTQTFKKDDFAIKPQGTWQSPSTGIIYPARFRVIIPAYDIDIIITPTIPNQEVDSRKSTIITYWEGLCDIHGTKQSNSASGHAYVELVGYDNRPLSQYLLHLFS